LVCAFKAQIDSAHALVGRVKAQIGSAEASLSAFKAQIESTRAPLGNVRAQIGSHHTLRGEKHQGFHFFGENFAEGHEFYFCNNVSISPFTHLKWLSNDNK
jgi:hypothetical protein